MVSMTHAGLGVRNRLPSSPGVGMLVNRGCSDKKSSSFCSKEIVEEDADDISGWKRDLRIVALILIASLMFVLGSLYFYVFAPLGTDGRKGLIIPTSLEAAQELGELLAIYATEHRNRLLFGHCLCYIFLQTFAIPGTVFFNLLAGALFGMWIGFPLCLVYNTVGSILLNTLSRAFGKRLVMHFFRQKLEIFRGVIDGHRDDLTIYMIFLRVFPFTPNWFLNMSSPHLEIPLRQFAPSVFIGLIPYNFLSCKAGLILSELRSRNDIIDAKTTIQLILFAVSGLLLHSFMKKSYSAAGTTVNQH